VTDKGVRNVTASVRARLLRLAQERGQDFDSVLVQYGLERLLVRLVHSPHAGRFVLKGATLFSLWAPVPHRTTRDLDLLGSGETGVSEMERVFREVCGVEVEPDGLVFDRAAVKGSIIREDQEYDGVRVTLLALLGRARLPLQVDIGIGDVIFPAPSEVEVPSLLGTGSPRLLAYPKETVVAEKLQAMVALGIANSRMKDFFDVWVLARDFPFDGQNLGESIRRTFDRRRTPLPEVAPLALTTAFGTDAAKQLQWNAFLRKTRLAAPALASVVAEIAAFLLPVVSGVRQDGSFTGRWTPGSGWIESTQAPGA